MVLCFFSSNDKCSPVWQDELIHLFRIKLTWTTKQTHAERGEDSNLYLTKFSFVFVYMTDPVLWTRPFSSNFDLSCDL